MNVCKEERLVGSLTPADLRRAVAAEGLHIPSNSVVSFYVMFDGRRLPVTYGVSFEVIIDAKNEQG